jgi:hypothetical protein
MIVDLAGKLSPRGRVEPVVVAIGDNRSSVRVTHGATQSAVVDQQANLIQIDEARYTEFLRGSPEKRMSRVSQSGQQWRNLGTRTKSDSGVIESAVG